MTEMKQSENKKRKSSKSPGLKLNKKVSYLSRIQGQIQKQSSVVNTRNASEMKKTSQSLMSEDDEVSAISSMDCVSEIYKQQLKEKLRTVKRGDTESLSIMKGFKDEICADDLFQMLDKAGDETLESKGFKLGMGRFKNQEEVQNQMRSMLASRNRRPRRGVTSDESFRK